MRDEHPTRQTLDCLLRGVHRCRPLLRRLKHVIQRARVRRHARVVRAAAVQQQAQHLCVALCRSSIRSRRAACIIGIHVGAGIQQRLDQAQR